MSNLQAVPQPRRASGGELVRPTTAAVDSTADIQTSSLIQLTPRVSESSVLPQKEKEKETIDEEEKRCWICYTSDAEEEAPKSDWKSPCRCTLIAHESCLLEWIADLQRSENNNSGGKIACPQCKTQIRLKQKRSMVLEVVEGAGRAVGKAVPVLILAGVGSVVFVACTVYGVNTIYAVCGPEYANRVLLGPDSEFSWTWRLGIGLPLIPFVLVASRTRTFESALPVLPLIFFCHSDPLYISFPPSPAITLALLPYLRVSYNSLWNRFIGPYEDRWIKDVTPAYALENSEQENNQRRAENNNNANAQRERRPENAPPREEVVNGWDGEVRLENHNIIVQGSNITNMILGALLWPSVARMVGENILGKWPKAWGGDVVRKCLPEGVVRNVVGGLIAVVLKDFISLYCKYKRAQQFRTRKVMNYNEVKKEKAAAAGRR
ncbi:uncharacterized protein H6S33_006729 [Morchella sextelata]|uniref:uncharacterized protein n=1 Tax=Morchella sextelata TaxID=1174677 RepID=UPI001D037565|nr:uncharacterized protein H6S33_006729 [Morchella sextelata]KAH0604352.1 hypothetical protein H6S33_006729 [Morchella sextelata]